MAEAFGERVAEIKRMYVVPAARGAGVTVDGRLHTDGPAHLIAFAC